MKIRFILLPLLLLATALSARAADLVGKWTAEFDSQIGVQKYTYEFKLEGDKLTGQATFSHQFGQGTVALKDVKLDGDKVSFNETLDMNGNQLNIAYSGTVAGDEMKLTRQVGDIATEQVTAKRAPAEAAK